ncbi:uncharacterized protein LOC143288443 [Babylonia areolata]|uniref:uncharacterized protein LOC143288443 n=1 Tax=Babylonia areolata TaxID=304850 RepID=UPI003FD38E53
MGMVPTQGMMFGLVIVVTLAVLTQAAAADLTNTANNQPLDDPAVARARRDTLPREVRGLMNHMTSLFRPGSPFFNLLMSFSSPVRRGLKDPFRRQPHIVRIPARPMALRSSSSSSTTCSPACTVGSQCCLLTPGASAPSCHSMALSGHECGWNHYTSQNPSTTEAIQQRTCPCLIGMACVLATPTQNGTCTFF